jgi:uncharacterized protein with HEPN domain
MKPLVDQRLRDALAAADLVRHAISDYTFDDYLGDVWLRSGIERQLEIIGEALNVARRLAPELAEQCPKIHEWIALRHIIAHGYDRIDQQIIWDTSEQELHQLIEKLEALLAEPGEKEAR